METKKKKKKDKCSRGSRKNQRGGLKAACGGRCWHPFREKSEVEAVPHTSTLLKGSHVCSHAKPWLNIPRAATPGAPPSPRTPSGKGRGREVDQVPLWLRCEMNEAETPSRRSADVSITSPLRSIQKPTLLLDERFLFLLNRTFTSGSLMNFYSNKFE